MAGQSGILCQTSIRQVIGLSMPTKIAKNFRVLLQQLVVRDTDRSFGRELERISQEAICLHEACDDTAVMRIDAIRPFPCVPGSNSGLMSGAAMPQARRT